MPHHAQGQRVCVGQDRVCRRQIAWDSAAPAHLREILVAVTHSLDDAALCYIAWLWAQRKSLPVVHPWLAQARGDLLG